MGTPCLGQFSSFSNGGYSTLVERFLCFVVPGMACLNPRIARKVPKVHTLAFGLASTFCNFILHRGRSFASFEIGESFLCGFGW